MKPIYSYPEFFLNKMGDCYWAMGHPSHQTLPEEGWQLSRKAHQRVSPESLSENEPQLTLFSEFGNIDYVRTGQPGAPTVVLIPGFPDCWYTYQKVIPLLAREYDVVSYSPPGHGYSTFTPLFDFSMDAYCRVAHMMLHRLGLKNVHLVGHSCGGEQVIRTTLRTKSQNLVKSMVLINAWGPSAFPRKTNWEFTDDVTTWPIVGKELVRLFGGKLGGMQDMFKRIFHRPDERKHLQNLLPEYEKPFLNGTAFRLFINNDTAEAICRMQTEQKKINESVENYFLSTRERYGYLPDIPVLVIGTKHDRIFPYSYARGLFRAIQKHNSRTYFKKIKPSGHMPTIETPKRLHYHLSTFLQKVETPEQVEITETDDPVIPPIEAPLQQTTTLPPTIPLQPVLQ